MTDEPLPDFEPEELSDEPAPRRLLLDPEQSKEGSARPDRHENFVRTLDWNLIGMILLIKLLLFLFAAHSLPILEGNNMGGLTGSLEIWNRWDSLNYLKLAQFGYSDGPLLVFYPLYPWVIRFLTVLTGNYLVSAILISTIASIAVGRTETLGTFNTRHFSAVPDLATEQPYRR